MKSNLSALALVLLALVTSLALVMGGPDPITRAVLATVVGGAFAIYLGLVGLIYLLIQGGNE